MAHSTTTHSEIQQSDLEKNLFIKAESLKEHRVRAVSNEMQETSSGRDEFLTKEHDLRHRVDAWKKFYRSRKPSSWNMSQDQLTTISK